MKWVPGSIICLKTSIDCCFVALVWRAFRDSSISCASSLTCSVFLWRYNKGILATSFVSILVLKTTPFPLLLHWFLFHVIIYVTIEMVASITAHPLQMKWETKDCSPKPFLWMLLLLLSFTCSGFLFYLVRVKQLEHSASAGWLQLTLPQTGFAWNTSFINFRKRSSSAYLNTLPSTLSF